MPTLTLVRRQGALEQVRYRKRDDGRHYYHDSDTPTDVVLGELGTRRKKRVTVLVPRGDVDGWERVGDTTWLSNPPASPTASRRSMSARKQSKRRPPKGYRTWSAYMASIRPGAKKKKRRRTRSTSSTSRARTSTSTSTKRASAGVSSMAKRRKKSSRGRARARTKIVYRNKPAKHHRRRRTSYRRNSPGGILGAAMSLGMHGALGGAAVLAGEGSARLIASEVFGKDPGSLAGGAIQAATGIAEGVTVEFLFGRGRHREMARTVAQGLVTGVAAGLMRTALKQMNIPLVTRALSDGGMRIIRPLAPGAPGQAAGRRGINGYVRPRLNGYVTPPLNGFNERVEQQLGYRS